jgi:hypothetical protein
MSSYCCVDGDTNKCVSSKYNDNTCKNKCGKNKCTEAVMTDFNDLLLPKLAEKMDIKVPFLPSKYIGKAWENVPYKNNKIPSCPANAYWGKAGEAQFCYGAAGEDNTAQLQCPPQTTPYYQDYSYNPTKDKCVPAS